MKRDLSELAVFSKRPAFAEPLHVGRPNVGDREKILSRIGEILDRRWFTNNGPVVQEFERRVADYLGVRHCVATCNATIALQIAIRALELTGEVIVPSFTFVATVHALSWQEVMPIFCDVNAETHCIDPDEIERLITPKTTGILPVHVWGNTCDVERISEIAERHRLKVLYDAAHAFSCGRGGRRVGGFGAAEVFSFHATKFFNSFEGGAITTNSNAIAEKCRLMRNFGFVGYDQVEHLGINGKMPEVCAAMGLSSFEKLDSFIAANRRNREAYATAFSDLPGVTLVPPRGSDEQNYQYVIVEIDAPSLGLNRDQLVRALHLENVLARRYFYPAVHRMKPYIDEARPLRRPLPVTERLVTRVMSLPSGTAVGPEQIQEIAALIRLMASNPSAVARALPPEH